MDDLNLSENLTNLKRNGELTKTQPVSPKRKAQQLSKTEVDAEQKTPFLFWLFSIDMCFFKDKYPFFMS